MKIFITVGTTRFDSLVEAASHLPFDDMFIQHANPLIEDRIINGTTFTEHIDKYYKSADVIITHAGAGSIYRLLEMGKKIIVEPNLERLDQHQKDISEYVENNGYCMVLWDIELLAKYIVDSESFKPNIYIKQPFFKADEICEIILKSEPKRKK